MKFELIEEYKYSDVKINDNYVTKFRNVKTFKCINYKDNQKAIYIIRIDFHAKHLDLLRNTGWELIGYSDTISQQESEMYQAHCRTEGLEENCEHWTNACKEYFEKIEVGLR